MISILLTLFLSIIYLNLIIFTQKQTNFCLDKVSLKEKHKILASSNDKIPLSGSFFFLPIIFYLFYSDDFLLSFFCLLLFLLGLLSDLKILSLPKNRFFLQILFIVIYLALEKNLILDLRLEFLNDLMAFESSRIIITSFFLLVLINGYNFIDGVNNLSTLNFIIILIFLYLLSYEYDNFNSSNIQTLILLFSVFIIFNFFGKSFLGDGGVYGISFLIGILFIKLSLITDKISPYFIANLLWYPAFENLFSIIRRALNKKKNYLADNFHLHHLIFKIFLKKKVFRKKYLSSSATGIIINSYLFLGYFIGYMSYSKTSIQVLLILTNILIYIFIYNLLLKRI